MQGYKNTFHFQGCNKRKLLHQLYKWRLNDNGVNKMIILYIFAGIGIATIALVGLLSLIYLFQDLIKQYKGKRNERLKKRSF